MRGTSKDATASDGMPHVFFSTRKRVWTHNIESKTALKELTHEDLILKRRFFLINLQTRGSNQSQLN